MIGKLRNCSLYRQLIIPMFSIGLISLLGTVYFSHILNDSVTAIDTVYLEDDNRLRNLEKIEKQIANYRSLSLRHLTEESFSAMEKIREELDQKRQIIVSSLPNSPVTVTPSNPVILTKNDYVQDLSAILRTYFEQMAVVIKLSTDFEKEAGFVLLSRTESEYLPKIKEITSQLIQYEFKGISTSRRALLSAATHNLYITIAIGVGGGGLLLLIAFMVIRNVTYRLSQLLIWSRKISQGDYAAPLIQGFGDEVGQLTGAMSEMAHSISDAHNKLEMSKRSAESIAETLQIYANAFENSGEAILITDRDNRIINVNRAFIRQTGYELSEVLGKIHAFCLAAKPAEIPTMRCGARWRAKASGKASSGTGKSLVKSIPSGRQFPQFAMNSVRCYSILPALPTSAIARQRKPELNISPTTICSPGC